MFNFEPRKTKNSARLEKRKQLRLAKGKTMISEQEKQEDTIKLDKLKKQIQDISNYVENGKVNYSNKWSAVLLSASIAFVSQGKSTDEALPLAQDFVEKYKVIDEKEILRHREEVQIDPRFSDIIQKSEEEITTIIAKYAQPASQTNGVDGAAASPEAAA